MKAGTILLHRAGLFPNLSPEEETQAFRLWRTESSITARDRIILSYLKLVRKMASSCSQRSPCDAESLFSAGTMGLLRAMESFDDSRGIRFATYAAWWIRHAMQECIDFATSIVRHRIRRKRTTSDSEAENSQDNYSGFVSLDKQSVEDGTNETWLDSLADDRATPEEEAMHNDTLQKRHEALRQAWTKLSETERKVMTLRYGRQARWTLEQVAQRFHMTHEGVRQIEKRSLKKLRGGLESLGHPRSFFSP